ncbi:MAG: acetoacetate decarboxylase family protein [Candidatus Eremiobacteraeota bacterium]|nr:acetoacetate decarboxylase family protein [Candidatus Eremiobacteraeota bacterium]
MLADSRARTALGAFFAARGRRRPDEPAVAVEPLPTFPPAPWELGGWGIATLGLVDSRAAAAFVPPGAQLVSILPGKTVGGLFFVSYDRGSLRYRELNVIAGIIRVGARFAFLLPRLYVDSPASLAGGRDIWGVPKELASFEVAHDIGVTSIHVRQGSRSVCRLRCSVPESGMRLPLPLPSFGTRDDSFLFFTGKMSSRVSPARAAVDFPAESEFGAVGFDRPRFAFRCDDLTLVVPAPRIVRRPVARVAASYGTS